MVTAVHARTGQPLAAGEALLTWARDAIRRPKPDLTAALLLPISESVHEAAAALRTEHQRRDIARRERARLAELAEAGAQGGLPGVARQRIVELDYEIERAEVQILNLVRELCRHGLEEEECAAVAQGAEAPPNPRLWRRVLEENALWTAQSTRLLGVLPADLTDAPWAIAAIGELTAVGALDADLVDAFAQTPAMRARFAEAAGLLLEGVTVGQVRHLAAEGALDALPDLRAPTGGAPDYDLLEVRVRPGERVAAGQVAARLADPRRAWVRLKPLPGEVPPLLHALTEQAPLVARPLVPGSGPDLEDLRLERVEEGTALATVANRVLHAAHGARTWALRPGQRYLVEVPLERFPGRFVLPAQALAERGPDLVVFRADGAGFAEVVVRVEYRDERIAVVADDGALFDGDPVVVEGAFALSLALEQRVQEGGGDAGHGHSHR